MASGRGDVADIKPADVWFVIDVRRLAVRYAVDDPRTALERAKRFSAETGDHYAVARMQRLFVDGAELADAREEEVLRG